MNKTRPKQLSFRVSEEEYQQLQEKISESGKNQQELCARYCPCGAGL